MQNTDQVQTYYIVIIIDNIRKIFDFTTEEDCKIFIVYEINKWFNCTPESEIDPELVEFYMKLSLEKLISKAKKYHSVKIEKCIIGKEMVMVNQ